MITVKGLKKHFKVYKKAGRLMSSFYSILKRKYSTVKAVDGISFKIGRGELVGFIGPNGAGKTTTLKCLSGLLYPTQGEILIENFRPFERKKEFLKKISLVMGQRNQLWWDLPAEDTFKLNSKIYELDEGVYKKHLADLVDLFGVAKLLNTPVRQLSLGERMKMELISSLIHKPEILFLDEPTIGLDVVAQGKIREFIREYNLKFNAAIILTSHYMNDVKALCERVVIIDQGRIIYDGRLSDLAQKYAGYKIIKFSSSSDPVLLRRSLSSLGRIIRLDEEKVIVEVLKQDTIKASGLLLNKFKISDITIEDPQIEDIIKKVFNRES